MKQWSHIRYGIILLLSLLLCVMAIFVHTEPVNAMSNTKIELTYNDGKFSVDDGYSVSVSGEGIVENSVFTNGYNFSDVSSYLKISAEKGESFTTETAGVTFSFSLQSTTSKFYSSNESLKPNVTDDFEQFLTVQDEDGNSASICMGGLYYYNGTKVTYSFPNKGEGAHALLGETQKTVYITIDFENKSIYIYSNGEQVQCFTSASSTYSVIENVIDLFKKKLSEDGGDFYIRKPVHSSKEGRNTASIILSDFKVFAKTVSLTDVKNEMVKKMNFPVSVKNLSESSYTVSLNGVGVASFNDSEHKTAVSINNNSSYISIKAGASTSLVSSDKGISFHFFHKSTTELFYIGNESSRPNVTDDFEQLFTVEGTNGASAHICLGGLYYCNGSSVTYAFPDTNAHALLKTNWKFVSVNVDKENTKITVYVDGVLTQTYDMSNSSSAVVKNVVDLFSEVAQKQGGEIFIRKPLSLRAQRNTATNILDDVIIANGGLTADEILSFYDAGTGKFRIRLIPSIQGLQVDDLVGTSNDVISSKINDVLGYNFEGLFYDENYENRLETDAKFTASTTMYAKYSLIEYTITYNYNGGDTVTENKSTFTIVSDGVTILPTSKKGYKFDGWYRTSDYKNQVSYLVSGSYGDVELFAKFSIINYKIDYDLNGGIFVDVPTEYYNVESPLRDIELVDAWKAGYLFEGWYLDKGCNDKFSSENADLLENITLYAKYSLEETSSGGTSDSASSDTSSSITEMSSVTSDSLSGDISKPENSSNKSTNKGCGGYIGNFSAILGVIMVMASIVFIFKKRG